MTDLYRNDWAEVYERFECWWERRSTDRPLLWVTAPRDRPLQGESAPPGPGVPDQYLDAVYLARVHRHRFEHTFFGGDAFPIVNANLGPGSLALYLGSEPEFAPDTVWFRPCIADLASAPLPEYDPESVWYARHLDLIRRLRAEGGDDYYVSIPDLVESVDILAAMRDPMHLLYDLIDRPELCHRWLARINELYFPHYDAFHQIVKDGAEHSVFTAFRIIGRGKVCKVQCDFAAMMSPDQFAEFYVPYVSRQIEGLDRSLYHLDGPDCIRHLDLLLGIEKLNAIQWVPGAGNPAADEEVWFPLYRRILDGGKGLHIAIRPERVAPIVRRFGARGLYLLTHAPSGAEAVELVAAAEKAGRGGSRPLGKDPAA